MNRTRTVGRFLALWLPPLVWMGVIYALSAQPDLPHAPGPWFDSLLKKAAHALEYGLLSWLLLRALRGHAGPKKGLRGASLVLGLLYAVSDEYHQTFVPGRHGDPFDVAIDTLGMCGVMGLDAWWAHRQQSRQAALAGSTSHHQAQDPPRPGPQTPAR